MLFDIVVASTVMMHEVSFMHGTHSLGLWSQIKLNTSPPTRKKLKCTHERR